MVLGHLLIFNHFGGVTHPPTEKPKTGSGSIVAVLPNKFQSVKLKMHREVMADFFISKLQS